ncbi:L-fuconolactonase [Shimia isoporae]|uniref:L-fuconolactonase n=1 Tax=Shimia isoporae TaxID=647720 RepID=A0A4R1NPZ5_9RHOB|nr:amidohydrolase family protein [Shimia isoporae]TCL10315.1 L-fuconolactonase [Shimia isoporae]
MIIDAHQHFWTLSRGDYPWPDESVAPIFRDFGPADLAPLLSNAGVDRTVIVQATDTVAETEFLLDIAEQTEWVAGVVGWVDLAANNAISEIDRLAKNPILKGLRPMLQTIEDTDWILQDAVAPSLAHMERTALRLDALIQPRHLSAIHKIAVKHPELNIVVDHIAKPAMGGAKAPAHDWVQGISELATLPNVHCKLSGVVTEVGPGWQIEDISPFMRHVLDAFGVDKVMFGSDWPVVNLASDYGTWRRVVDDALAPFSEADRAKILGANAARFYDL